LWLTDWLPPLSFKPLNRCPTQLVRLSHLVRTSSRDAKQMKKWISLVCPQKPTNGIKTVFNLAPLAFDTFLCFLP
jgi:hypothetical protein